MISPLQAMDEPLRKINSKARQQAMIKEKP